MVTRDADAFAWIAAPRAGKLVHSGLKGTAALAGPLVRMRYGINDETAALGLEKTAAAFDRLEVEIGPSGYLVGDSFTVADLTAAALFFPLVRPPESENLTRGELPAPLQAVQDEYRGRPAGSGCGRCIAATAASLRPLRRSRPWFAYAPGGYAGSQPPVHPRSHARTEPRAYR